MKNVCVYCGGEVKDKIVTDETLRPEANCNDGRVKDFLRLQGGGGLA